MKKAKFKGTGVALVTPFDQQRVDYDALERLINHLIGGGADYLVSLGTTGEAVTLSPEECREVFDFTIEKVAGRKPLVAGLFGSNYTEKLVRIIEGYDFAGFDAIMSSNPAYSKPSQEGIYQHYMAIERASPLPIIIYNIPGRTSSNVLPQTILRLARSSRKFIAVKEASGDLTQAMQIIRERPDGFLVICGEDPLTLPMLSVGGDGAISVIANAYPRHFTEMVRRALRGDFQMARKLHYALLHIHPWLYAEGNPTGIKGALEVLTLCRREVRLPLTPLSAGALDSLREAMAEVPDAKIILSES